MDLRHEAHPPAEAKDRQKAEQEGLGASDSHEDFCFAQDMQGNMELFLRGLCSFCPSVDCMMKLVAHLRSGHDLGMLDMSDLGPDVEFVGPAPCRKSWEPLLEVITPMIFSRFRSLNFGKAGLAEYGKRLCHADLECQQEDKECLRKMIQEVRFMSLGMTVLSRWGCLLSTPR